MDLRDLRSVGRASILVAIVGVVVPMATGAVAGLALGFSGEEAVFVGAALTATSVGITARVFGDLRALAIGRGADGARRGRRRRRAGPRHPHGGHARRDRGKRLRARHRGSHRGGDRVRRRRDDASGCGSRRRSSPGSGATAGRRARSWCSRFAFTLAFAELAHLAELAPIIGAFVAGLALARTSRRTASAASSRRSATCSCRSSSCRSASTPTSRPFGRLEGARHRRGAPRDRRARQARGRGRDCSGAPATGCSSASA